MNYVGTIKQGAYKFLEEKSIALKKQGTVPESFTARTLRRAKKKPIQFSKAFSLAAILRDDAKEVGIDADLKKIIMVAQVENSKGKMISVSRDIYKDLGIWITTVGYFCFFIIIVYTMAIALKIPMEAAFPVIGIFVSGLSAVVIFKKSKFPMPFNLKLVSCLFYGAITGGGAFYAHSIIQPETLYEFSQPLKKPQQLPILVAL